MKYILIAVISGISGAVLGGYLAVETVLWKTAAYRYFVELGSFSAAFAAVAIAISNFWWDARKTVKDRSIIRVNACNVMLAKLMVLLKTIAGQHHATMKNMTAFLGGGYVQRPDYSSGFEPYAAGSLAAFEPEFIQALAVHEDETKGAFETYLRQVYIPKRDAKYYDVFARFLVINIVMYMCRLAGEDPHNKDVQRKVLEKYEVPNPDQFLVDISAEILSLK